MELKDVYPLNIINDMWGEPACQETYIREFLDVLDCLKENYKSLIEMKYKKGLNLNECALLLNLSQSETQILITEALEELKSPFFVVQYTAVSQLDLLSTEAIVGSMQKEIDAYRIVTKIN